MLNLNEDIIDLTGIEDEEIEDNNGNIYKPERFNKCFIPQNDLAKTISSITLKFLLSKMKYTSRNPKIYGTEEIYIISGVWYEKWKNYSRYQTMKRIIKAFDAYKTRPIKYTPNESKFPGKINNKNLLIRNKINENDRNILVSKLNNALDTRLNCTNKKKYNDNYIKLLSKERFDLLNNYFKCDYIIKSNRIIITKFLNYDFYSVHLNLVFIPTLSTFKSVNKDNIKNFQKNQKIIYDIYFKQNDTKKEICTELFNILKEKPQILLNMGVELNIDNNEEQLFNHIKNFKFYIPNINNTKSIKEMIDFIFNKETIEKIKKDEKISNEDINIQTIYNEFDLSKLFHLDFINSKNNIDEVINGIIFLEYIIFDDIDSQKVASIFEI